ncbi:MAG TPA: response regulator [Thermoanaerobaculia bacterium]|nr:response regulator [Thermoanaerobaculia bacterium]
MSLTSVVVIVDDNDDTRDALEWILRDEGFEIRTARDGRQALKILTSGESPCAVLLDHRMPDIDGLQVLDEIAKSPRGSAAPVIFISGDLRGLAEAESRGAIPVRKPFEADALVDLVRNLCNRNEEATAS